MSKQTLFLNASIVDGSHPEPRAGHVLVEDGIIRDVDARAGRADGREVIDLRGKTLMPGLIDCHVHVVASMMDLTANAQLPDAMAILRSLPLMKGMLDRGFTTVRDVGGAPFALAEAVAQGYAPSPRLVVCGKALAKTGGHADNRPREDTYDATRWSRNFGALGRVVGRCGRSPTRLPAGASTRGTVPEDHGEWRRVFPYRPDCLAGLFDRRDDNGGRGSAGCANLCRCPPLHAGGDPPGRAMRSALLGALQPDRSGNGSTRRRSWSGRGADARHLRGAGAGWSFLRTTSGIHRQDRGCPHVRDGEPHHHARCRIDDGIRDGPAGRNPGAAE